jgi:putative transposase
VLLKETHAMTAPSSIDPARFLHEQLASASPDLLRSMLTTFVNTLMSAEVDVVCGACYGQSSPERVNVRNGYRHREFDTRVGTLDVAIPKLREGSYYPDWLLERRRRAERALTTVVATCYLLGVSTRRMERLVDSLGITKLSRTQVSVMARELDTAVADFRGRPLDAGPYTFVAADALVLKVREVAEWSMCMRWWRPGSTLMGTGKSSGCRSPRPRTARAGWRSSAT